MNVVPNHRWPELIRSARAPALTEAPREPAVAGPTRTLLVLLSELRHHQVEVARIEAEVAIHARAFADAQGEFLRPTPAQLRQRLSLATEPAAGVQPSKVAP